MGQFYSKISYFLSIILSIQLYNINLLNKNIEAVGFIIKSKMNLLSDGFTTTRVTAPEKVIIPTTSGPENFTRALCIKYKKEINHHGYRNWETGIDINDKRATFNPQKKRSKD